MPVHARVQYQCSFCGKEQERVHRLIAGPGVYICDECVALCVDIISEESRSRQSDVETLRALLAETRHRYVRDESLCPLCRNPLGEDDTKMIVGVYDGPRGAWRNVLWRCHASCFRERSTRGR